jgi:hypothetical protein
MGGNEYRVVLVLDKNQRKYRVFRPGSAGQSACGFV